MTTESHVTVANEAGYEPLSIPLNATLNEYKISTDAKILVVGQCPIEVLARINLPSAKQIDLRLYRGLTIPIKRIYLTTTTVSTDPLELLFSNQLEVSLLGAGARVELIDAGATPYDARDTVTVLADSSVANINNGASYTSDAIITTGYNKLTIMVYSNKELTLEVQQSWDGTNYDEVTTIDIDDAVKTNGHSVEVIAPYMKIKLSNASGANTTTMRMGAYLSTGA